MRLPVSDDPKTRIQNALNKEDLPAIYFNGFALSIGNADVGIFLERNGEPVAMLNASFTSAKPLALKLNGLIQRIEESGNTIMTTDNVQQSLRGD
jgi:hypothetical protein